MHVEVRGLETEVATLSTPEGPIMNSGLVASVIAF